jgi:hypothetical protein
MTRTNERTTVTSEAVPDVVLTLSADRGYHGTALSHAIVIGKTQVPDSGYSGTGQTALGVGQPRSDDVRAHPVRAPRGRGCASASWATRPAPSLLSTPGRSSHSSQPKS